MFDTWVQAAPAILDFLRHRADAPLITCEMRTSQLSEASSAVWIRLSGTRSRSALRSVTVDDVPALVAGDRVRSRR